MKRYKEGILNGKSFKTATAVANIRKAIRLKRISLNEMVLKEGERLDIIAARQYGDARLWWVIAAASNIGWWMQVPPGTILRVPVNIGEVLEEM